MGGRIRNQYRHGKSKSSKTIAVAVAAVGMMLSSAAVQAAGLTWGTGAVAADDEQLPWVITVMQRLITQ